LGIAHKRALFDLKWSCRLELFDHLEFDRWVERGEAPAIPSSLTLYNEVRDLGFKTFLLTGRSEGHEGVTVDNLRKEGFHDWDKLILRYYIARASPSCLLMLPLHIATFHPALVGGIRLARDDYLRNLTSSWPFVAQLETCSSMLLWHFIDMCYVPNI
jgi:hypothetical protein